MLSARFQLGRDPRPSPACKASTQLPASLSSTRGKKSWTSDPRLATNQQRCFSNPGDADVAVEHTPRHVLLELGTFRRASMEEALQHRTTLIFERVSGLDGHKWIVEIPAAQVPPLSRLARDTVDEAYPVICPLDILAALPAMARAGAARNKPPKWTSGMLLARKTLTLSRQLSTCYWLCWRSLCARP